MRRMLLNELNLLKNTPYIIESDFNKFNQFLNTSEQFTRPQNLADHVCCFFLPVYTKTKSIYLGHHTKADDWIPPGGHIELNENPKDTVLREFNEELDYKLVDESIELFTITIEQLKQKPNATCKTHYDFWYLVYMDSQIDFKFDTREFYDAKWFSIDQAISISKHSNYKKVIKQFLNKHL